MPGLEGLVQKGRLMSATFSAEMTFDAFPFDSQSLQILVYVGTPSMTQVRARRRQLLTSLTHRHRLCDQPLPLVPSPRPLPASGDPR